MRTGIIEYYQKSENFENSFLNNENDVFYQQIFSVVISSQLVNLKNSGVTESFTNPSAIALILKQIYQQMTKTENQQKLLNAINIRLLITSRHKSGISESINKGIALVEETEKHQKELTN